VEVDEQLYTLYEQLPRPRPGHRSMIRSGKTPKEVMAEGQQSPMAIDQVGARLVRRRVLKLSPDVAPFLSPRCGLLWLAVAAPRFASTGRSPGAAAAGLPRGREGGGCTGPDVAAG
jgi:hypothetical protein